MKQKQPQMPLKYFKILALIETAENEFNQLIEEELQRRIKEHEAHEHPEKPRKSPKNRKKKEEHEEVAHDSDKEEHEEDVAVLNGTANVQNGHEHTNGVTTNGHTNGTTNGHHENGHNKNGFDEKSANHET